MPGGLINFCHPAFHPRIVCNKVCADGYEVTNLVSGNYRSAFRVESFIKPPVTIILEFPCNIEVDKIIINGALGSQKSAGVMIYSYSRKQTKCLSDFSAVHVDNAYYGDIAFKMLARMSSKDLSMFYCKNIMYHLQSQYKQVPAMISRYMGEPCVEEELKTRGNPLLLNSASHLAITITHTHPGSVAAIRYVEVWGVPAASCLPQLVQEIMQIHKKIVSPQPVTVVHKVSESSESVSAALNLDNEVCVPNEYLDPITQEVMTLPVLLPSGHTVDQSTLDRHSIEEEKWGRPPSDPFTGLTFTTSRKPMPNTVLKVRIDKFILQSGSHITTQGRTVGRKDNDYQSNRDKITNKQSALVSSLLDSSDSVETSSSSSISSGRLPAKLASKSDGNSKFKGKRTYKKEEEQSSKRIKCNVVDLTCDNENNVEVIDLTETKVDMTENKHEDKLTKSLDDALDEALKFLPSFNSSKCKRWSKMSTGALNPGPSSNKNVKLNGKISESSSKTSAVLSRYAESSDTLCTLCSKTVEVSALYKLPCCHLVCRSCLISHKDKHGILCVKCKMIVSSKDIVKAQR